MTLDGATASVLIGSGKLIYANTPVTATGAELNYLDITTLGTSEASKAVTADENGDVVIGANIADVLTVAGRIVYQKVVVSAADTVTITPGSGSGGTYFELAAHGIQMTLTIATAGATAGQLIYIRNKDDQATSGLYEIPAETTVQYIYDGSDWRPVKEATSRRRLLASDAEDTGFTPVSNPLFSDKRLKKDIQTIQNASEKLQNIRGVTYYFDKNIHTKDIKHLPKKEQIGVIAQEVEKVLPQVVTENDNGVKNPVNDE